MNDELLSEFVTESIEHISDIEPLLLEMETSGLPTMDQMNQIFRAVHSIKGAAGFLGLGDIARLSHSGENLLILLRDGNLEFEASMADPLLTFVDELRKMLESLPDEAGDFPEDLLALIEAIASGDAQSDETKAAPSAEIEPAGDSDEASTLPPAAEETYPVPELTEE
jgi:two-component system, chemotaxis family, sensor kinase CheA